MKILYVITKSEIGGAQTHLSQLVQYFHSKGDELYVMSHPGGWLEKEISGKATFLPNNYFSNSFNPINAIKGVLEIKKAVKNINPDLVHCHSSGAAAFTRLAVLNKVPVVYTAHGWGFNLGTSTFQKIAAVAVETLLALFTKKIICVSKFVKNLALRYRIAPENKMIVVYNGVQIEPESTKESGTQVKIITIGRLAEPKLPELLIKSLKACPEEVKRMISVLVVGEGEKRSEIENEVGGEISVEIKTIVPSEIKNALRNSDIFMLLSRWEGFPYSIIEAMEAGLPVIASNVGGISEAVVNGKNGFLVDNNNLEQISSCISRLVADRDLRIKMGMESRKTAVELFSLKNMLERTSGVYQEIIR